MFLMVEIHFESVNPFKIIDIVEQILYLAISHGVGSDRCSVCLDACVKNRSNLNIWSPSGIHI